MSKPVAPSAGHTCCKPMRSGPGYFASYAPCGKTAKFERKGEWFCGTHDPDRLAAKRAETSAKWTAEWAENAKRDRLNRAAPKLLAASKLALENLVEGLEEVGVEVEDEPLVIALRAAISEAEGTTA